MQQALEQVYRRWRRHGAPVEHAEAYARRAVPARAVRATAAELSALRSALDTLPTTPWGSNFSCPGGAPPAASYLLTFGYLVGPPVQVTVNQRCRPAIYNGNLQAEDATAVLPLVQQLFAGP